MYADERESRRMLGCTDPGPGSEPCGIARGCGLRGAFFAFFAPFAFFAFFRLFTEESIR